MFNTTTGDPFQNKTKHKLYSIGLGPQQDHQRQHSLQDRRIRPIAHQGADQGVCLIVSHVDGQLESSQHRSIRVRKNSSLNGNRALDLSQKRMIVGKIQGFATENHLCCSWSRYLRRHLHPLRDGGSLGTAHNLLLQCPVPRVFVD